MAVLCPSCGTIRPDAEATCDTCGTDLRDGPVALVGSARPSGSRRSFTTSTRARRRVAAVVAVIASATVAGLLATWSLRGTERGARAAWITTPQRVPAVAGARGVVVIGLGRGHSTVRRADLSTGRVDELQLSGSRVSGSSAVASADTVLVEAVDQHLYAIGAVTRRHPRVVDLGLVDGFGPASRAGRFWLSRAGELLEIDGGGTARVRTPLPRGWVFGSGEVDRDRVVLQRATDDGFAIWDPHDRRFVLTQRAGLLAARGRVVVSARCDTRSGACHAVATDLADGTARVLPEPVWDTFTGQVLPAQLSRDGRRVAFGSALPGHDGTTASMAIVDTRLATTVWSAEVAESSSDPVAWDVQGRLLFFDDGKAAFVRIAQRDQVVRLSTLDQFTPLTVVG